MATITGKPVGEFLLGTDQGDVISGLAGDDTINARKAIGGTDVANGGTGIDTLLVGAGGETQSVTFNYYVGSFSSASGNFRIQFTGIEKLHLTGGSGDDTFYVKSSSARPPVRTAIDGGLGIDTLTIHLILWDEPIFFNLAAPAGWIETGTADGYSAYIRGFERVTITGSSFDDIIQGGSLADIIEGAGGNDFIDAGACSAGADRVNGGTGTDTLIVDASDASAAVTASLTTAGSVGQFRVLAVNMERLHFEGGSGADRATGGSSVDRLTGNAGNDKLFGGGASDILNGGAGHDILDGGPGPAGDGMTGGTGNDTYILDSPFDAVFELVGGGTDRIMSFVTINYIYENVEQYVLLGSSNINCIGNAGPNTITGNSGNNVLNGGAHNDVLSGVGGADTLNGFSGNDTLDGGVGADTMSGGLGNDLFRVDNALDKVVESSNQGTDTVITTVSYALGSAAHVETLRTPNSLTTATPVTLTGNDFGQFIHGNAGANRIAGRDGIDFLFGHGGNDILNGGRGNDKLLGGSNNDTFFFNAPLVAANADTIVDFFVPHDTIALENAVFTGLAVGTLAASAFHTGAAAHDANDRIVYNKATGALIFDSNGIAAGGAVQFAKLSPNLTLTNADFVVV